MERNEGSNNFIIIVGEGSEFNRIKKWINDNNPENLLLLEHLNRDDYLALISGCDVGLIFLNHAFTVPNIPSRLLSYLEVKLPILAATDLSTDLKEIIEESGMGYWCESNDAKQLVDLMNNFKDSNIRKTMGENGYRYLINNYLVERSYNAIMQHFS